VPSKGERRPNDREATPASLAAEALRSARAAAAAAVAGHASRESDASAAPGSASCDCELIFGMTGSERCETSFSHGLSAMPEPPRASISRCSWLGSAMMCCAGKGRGGGDRLAGDSPGAINSSILSVYLSISIGSTATRCGFRVKGALCAYVIRLRVSYNQNDEPLSQNSLRYLSQRQHCIHVC